MPSRLRSLFHFQESGLILVVLVLGLGIAVFSGSVKQPVYDHLPDGTYAIRRVANADGRMVPLFHIENKFLNARSLVTLAKQTSFIAIMAVGMAVVIISGGIDLSVGAIYALASVVGALVLHHYGPSGPAQAASSWLGVILGAAACVGIGALCGLINGGFIVGLRMHPFIITLGSMAILRGIAFVLTTGQSVTDFPPQLQAMVNYEVGNGLAIVPLLVMVLVTIIGALYLTRLAAGRRVYAVGGNEIAARFSGINVARVKLGVYLISGLATGVAALMAIGCYGAASSSDGQGYELNVIAAAVVGGASLTGGRGSALGAMLGALIIQMIDTGIVDLDLDQNYSKIIIGAAIIAAVALDTFNSWLARRRLARQAH
ncbi:MAG: ABC transporter permease [Opitutales bacterium]